MHRVGRTARAGASGAAISFACEDFAHYLMDIEEYIGHQIDNERVETDLLVKPKPAIKMERRPPPRGAKHSKNYKGNRNQPRRHG